MILLQIHHMWYETALIEECWDSIVNALRNAPDVDVRIEICFNEQTYIEKPSINATPRQMFDKHSGHTLLTKYNPKITFKTDDDPFYNIADWRREIYDPKAKYTVWGETDCLMPRDFFAILNQVEIDQPHLLTFASRPMWDNSWDVVTHEKLQGYSKPCECGDNHKEDCIELLDAPLKYKDTITQKELDTFNDESGDINLQQVPLKIDGSLVCISKGMQTPFIAPGMHFVREDFCLEQVSRIRNIPQVCVTSRLKGHNYKHPRKRTGTLASRNDEIFQKYANESQMEMAQFLTGL